MAVNSVSVVLEGLGFGLGEAALWCERPGEAEAVVSEQELSQWLMKAIETLVMFFCFCQFGRR